MATPEDNENYHHMRNVLKSVQLNLKTFEKFPVKSEETYIFGEAGLKL